MQPTYIASSHASPTETVTAAAFERVERVTIQFDKIEEDDCNCTYATKPMHYLSTSPNAFSGDLDNYAIHKKRISIA